MPFVKPTSPFSVSDSGPGGILYSRLFHCRCAFIWDAHSRAVAQQRRYPGNGGLVGLKLMTLGLSAGLLVLSVVSGMVCPGVAFAAVPFLGLFLSDLVHQV